SLTGSPPPRIYLISVGALSEVGGQSARRSLVWLCRPSGFINLLVCVRRLAAPGRIPGRDLRYVPTVRPLFGLGLGLPESKGKSLEGMSGGNKDMAGAEIDRLGFYNSRTGPVV
ncbi:hypothetical protein U1Q18_007470, partial [Sarracenia purpurea var. burkii]